MHYCPVFSRTFTKKDFQIWTTNWIYDKTPYVQMKSLPMSANRWSNQYNNQWSNQSKQSKQLSNQSIWWFKQYTPWCIQYNRWPNQSNWWYIQWSLGPSALIETTGAFKKECEDDFVRKFFFTVNSQNT